MVLHALLLCSVLNVKGQDSNDSLLYQSIHQHAYFEFLADSFSVDINTKHIFNFQKTGDEADQFYRVMFDGQVVDDKQESLTYFYQSGKGKVFGKEGTNVNRIELEQTTLGDPQLTKAFSEPINIFKDSVRLEANGSYLYSPLGNTAYDRFDYEINPHENESFTVYFKMVNDSKFDRNNFFKINSLQQITKIQWISPNTYKVPLADSIRLTQEFIYLNDTIIMPVLQEIEYLASYKDYFSVGKISSEFSNLIMNANLGDSSAFKPKMIVETTKSGRMSNVTFFENTGNGALQAQQETADSMSYLDSIDKKYNSFDLLNWVFVGYHNHNRKKHQAISLNPFISNVQFNMVEGWVFNFGGKFIKKQGGFNHIISTDYRYSFSGSRPFARISFRQEDRKNKALFTDIGVGSYIQQFNGSDPYLFSTFLLFFPSDININKLYAKEYFRFRKGFGKAYDWDIDVGMEYGNRRSLTNLPDPLGILVFPYFPAEEMDNSVLNGGSINFPTHQYLNVDFSSNFTLNHLTADNNEHHQLRFKYMTSLPNFLGSDLDFTDVNLTFHGVKNFEGVDGLRYAFTFGQFWSKNNMYLMDYHHVISNKMFIYEEQSKNFEEFYILDFYRMMSNTWYTEAHLSKDFTGMARNIGFIEKKGIRFGGEIHSSYVPGTDTYTEAVLSMSGRLKVLKTNFIASFEGASFKRVGVSFGVTL